MVWICHTIFSREACFLFTFRFAMLCNKLTIPFRFAKGFQTKYCPFSVQQNVIYFLFAMYFTKSYKTEFRMFSNIFDTQWNSEEKKPFCFVLFHISQNVFFVIRRNLWALSMQKCGGLHPTIIHLSRCFTIMSSRGVNAILYLIFLTSWLTSRISLSL